jgi:hypothetical protein
MNMMAARGKNNQDDRYAHDEGGKRGERENTKEQKR